MKVHKVIIEKTDVGACYASCQTLRTAYPMYVDGETPYRCYLNYKEYLNSLPFEVVKDCSFVFCTKEGIPFDFGE